MIGVIKRVVTGEKIFEDQDKSLLTTLFRDFLDFENFAENIKTEVVPMESYLKRAKHPFKLDETLAEEIELINMEEIDFKNRDKSIMYVFFQNALTVRFSL